MPPPSTPARSGLFRTGDGTPVEAAVNTSGGGDSIVLKPLHPLDLNTQYTFEVLPAVKDTGGASFQHFTASFTTASSSPPDAVPGRVRPHRTAGN